LCERLDGRARKNLIADQRLIQPVSAQHTTACRVAPRHEG
jgi:hypothetical protein